MSQEHLQQLDERLKDLGFAPEDITERFIRAGGPGGQHVNKTSTAVQLRHEPSGLEVRAESERSQLRNRIVARELLIEKIEGAKRREAAERRGAQEKRRRQLRRPSRAARKRNVEKKRNRGGVKRLRRRVRGEE
ncbi:MAG: peptide chain release factor-like protein [Deltaproteobacteria bacterium]|nr:peptide chain release factor-like protein [Deltaproteobacteria bacterium]